ncbi:MAG: PAS domain-containing protein [Gemmatimonadaceae bacterium]
MIDTDIREWVEGFPGLMVTMSVMGQVELFSNEVLEYFGKTAEELRTWQLTDAVHPDDLLRVIAAFTESVTTGKPYTIEHRCRRADGAYRWFQVRALAIQGKNDHVTGWFVVLSDIDDVKRAEERMRATQRNLTETIDALRRSETFLLEIQRLSHTGGWRYDVATDTVESSPEIQRFYDPQPHEDISKPAFWFDRIHPDDRPRVQSHFVRCLQERTEYQDGYRILLPDGAIRYQYATGHPVVDAAGNLVEFMGASMDMTEHWQASTELHQTSETLRELQIAMSRAAHVATAGELAASIAHEVNQPLSGIITNSSTCLRMLDAEPPNVDGARETARRTIRDGNRASEVVARLRGLFSKQEFTFDWLDLNEATQEVIALSSSDLQRNNITVESDLDERLPQITGDRIQLQQVILNLIRNATDAMTDVDGRPRRLIVRTVRDSDGVRFTVRDTGTGIDPDSANKVFNAFYTTKNGGMGIGLSVSRSIIESHHGRIWAESNDDIGATFAFSIPTKAKALAIPDVSISPRVAPTAAV